MNLRKFAVLFTFLVALASTACLQAAQNPDWMRPFPPFHVAGNLYYVGSVDLALISSSRRRGSS